MHLKNKHVRRSVVRFSCIVVTLTSSLFLLPLGVLAQQSSEVYIPVKKIIRYLEKRFDSRFFYEENTIDFHKKVLVDLPRMSLEEVLEKLSEELSLTYKKSHDNLILLKKTVHISETARKRVLVGSVFDAVDRAVLPEVGIMGDHTEYLGTTGADGRYRITLPENTTSITFISHDYRPLFRAVPMSDSLNVSMERYQIELDEVLVVGFGEQAVKNVAGAVSVLSRGLLRNFQNSTASEFLYGMSGIYVNKAGAQPGIDNSNVSIRGLSSFGYSKPLVLVDGVEYQLGDLNPIDIESITILKDAASAAIYGVKSANGVVLVKTKRAVNEKVRMEYKNSFGWQQVTSLPDAVWDPVLYMKLKNRALANEGKAPDYTSESIWEYASGMKTDPYTYPATNWFDLAFRRAFEQEHNLQMRFARSPYSIYASVGFLDQKGVLIGTDSRRYSFTLNSSYDLSSRISMFINLKGLHRSVCEPHTSIPDYMTYVTRSLPVYAPYLADGRYGDSWVKTPGHNIFIHPLAHATEGLRNTIHQRVLFHAGLNYSFLPGTKYSLDFSYNKYDMDRKIFHPVITTYDPKTFEVHNSDTERKAQQETLDQWQIAFNQSVTWDCNHFEMHHWDMLAGMSFLENMETGFQASAEGFLNNQVTDVSAGNKNYKTDGHEYLDRLISFYGRGRYSYREKYLFEVVVRCDGSSRFAAGERWGLFPSFALAWRMEQEPFMEALDWLSMLKWRLSWGKLGNQEIENNQYSDRLESGNDYNFGEGIYMGVTKKAYFNPGITWEKTAVVNAGVDVFLCSNRVKMNAEYYYKRTYDVLQRLKKASQAGNLESAITNIGEIRNRGFELSVLYQDKKGNFNYSLGGTVGYVRNEVGGMDGHEIMNDRMIVRDGYPVDSYFLLQADGIFRDVNEVAAHAFQSHNTKPGDIKFTDADRNGVIDDNDRVVTGKCFPDYVYSFSMSLGYKGFELSAFWQGVKGVNTYPIGNLALPFYNGAGITREWVDGSWTTENPDAALPRLMQANSGHDNYTKASTFWLQDASYLRLKNILLRYNLPKVLLEKIRLEKVSLFICGQNLWTLSGFKEFDPEKDLKNPSLYEYPAVKKWSLGVNVTF